jgi:hypothetical protein
MMFFLIFLLLFNINVPSKAYFYSPDDPADINTKQCFCEVSFQ